MAMVMNSGGKVEGSVSVVQLVAVPDVTDSSKFNCLALPGFQKI